MKKLGIPDLVVQKRGQSGAASNLRVCEFQDQAPTLADDSDDAKKIGYWMQEFGYQLGALVGFDASEGEFQPQVERFENGSWPECVRPQI